MQDSEKALPLHIQNFLDWLDVEKGLSSKSQENYFRFIKRFTDWLAREKLQNLKPHELTPEHIWSYRLYLSRGDSLKKSTQNYYLIALRSLLTYFADRDILSLPSDKVKLARDKSDKEVRFLTLEQLKKLFATPNTRTPQGLRDKAILEAFFSTGMRISELTSLNREQMQILIKPGTDELELSITGKGKRIRTVYFSKRSLKSLREYLASRNDDEKALFINYRRKQGSPTRLSPRAIERSLKQYVVRAGLPINTTPHVMRHSFATDLLSQGVDIRVLQEFLGHRNISATQIYAHVTSKKLREIHKKYHGLVQES